MATSPHSPSLTDSSPVCIDRGDLQQLLVALAGRGYEIIGPTMRDGAIVCGPIQDVAELPAGWTDVQEPGAYRLQRRDDDALFGYNLGQQGWRRVLRPPLSQLWQAERVDGGFRILQQAWEAPKRALIGVRPCELAAILVQDRVLLGGPFVDPYYQARREATFIVAVNCGQAGGTCFCASMGTGPGVDANGAAGSESAYDLAMTEVIAGEDHYLVVTVGTKEGRAVLEDVPHRLATAGEIAAAEAIVAETAQHMGRHLETEGLREIFYRNLEHPYWNEVAKRCLTCGNCTLVCPTCFCVTIEDVTDPTGQHAERWRKDDSCFSIEFSHIYGGSVRASPGARYRQWISHKLGTWVDQFGVMGCVGCGRCITWCPVGIDITAEADAMRRADAAAASPRPAAQAAG